MQFKRLSSFVLLGAVCFSAAAHARSIVETQQSTAYELPGGWTVLSWTEKTGEATLTNKTSGDLLKVERFGLAGTPTSYPNSEDLASGRTLTWEYTETTTGIGDSQLRGEVKFADAIVRIVVWDGSVPFTVIDQKAGLVAMRSIAASVKILGPRKCWPAGECPPGEVKEEK